MDKRMRVFPRHWEVLLDFLQEHPELLTGKLNQAYSTKANVNQLWTEITEKLNSLGMGTKTQEKWKQALHDWKYKTKMKLLEMVNSKSDFQLKPFSQHEQRLIALTGWNNNFKWNIACGSSETIIPPTSPPPLIPLEGKVLPESHENNNSKKSTSDEESRGLKRKRSEMDRIDEYQKETIELLEVIANNMQGILGELKVISNALVQISEK